MISPRRSKASRVTTALTVPAVLLLAACGSSGAGGEGPLVPGDAPDGWTAHEMGPVTVSVPTDWEVLDVEAGADADEAYGLRAPGDGPGSGVHTAVARSRARDAADAVENLRNIGESTLGARDASMAELSWPGAEAGAYLTYESTLPVGGEDVDLRYEYLVLDLADERQVIVSAAGPTATYDELAVHEVLTTVTVD